MDINSLRILAGTSVLNSKSPKNKKIELLNFIQNEATKHDLMVFIMDGKITPISEISKQIIQDRFDNFEYLNEFGFFKRFFKSAITTTSVVATLVSLFGDIGYRLYKKLKFNFDAKKKCASYKDNAHRYKVCKLSLEIKFLEDVKKLLLYSKSTKCKEKKNPEKCANKVDKAIKRIEAKIDDLVKQTSQVGGN